MTAGGAPERRCRLAGRSRHDCERHPCDFTPTAPAEEPTNRPVRAGDPVHIRLIGGEWAPAYALSSPEPTHRDGVKIHDFPVVWVSTIPDGVGVPWPVEDVRRVEIGATVPAVAQDPTHRAARGSDVEAWIKRHRDQYERDDHVFTESRWDALDALLDDYRDHADTGTPLTEDVEGPEGP